LINPIQWILSNHDGAYITSPFGLRDDPLEPGNTTFHNGTDIGGVRRYLPWKSPLPGEVVYTGNDRWRGKHVVIRIRNTNINQIFQHLNEKKVVLGKLVETGDVVGTNGATGDVTGFHLHYELRVDDGSDLGRPVWGDPEEFYWNEGGIDMEIYEVQPNDTLYKIAKKFDVTVDDLVEWNKHMFPSLLDNKDLIRVGWKLYVSEPTKVDADLKMLKKRIGEVEGSVLEILNVMSEVQQALEGLNK